MKWYHGTGLKSKNRILKNGFKITYGRFGNGVYFTNDKKEALNFGNDLIKIIIKDDEIVQIFYPDLIKIYPDLSIDEEEGITDLENYITNSLNKKGVILTYASGDKELCVYDTSIIKIIN